MAKKIQPDTLETLNHVARYLHFDPGARKGVLTREQLSLRTGIGYNKLTRIMTDFRFAVVFDENELGSITLSGEIPNFLADSIDLDTPYVPIYTCNNPAHSVTTGRATPHIKSQPKKHNADYIDPKIVRKYLSPERMQDFIDMLNRNYHKPTGKDDPYWEWVNLANTLSVVLALLINKDPEAKLAELVDKPEVFNEKAPNLVKGIKTAYEETKNV